MKRLIYPALVAMLAALFGCENTVRETVEYTVNEPVFMSAAEFRSQPIDVLPPHEIAERGKLCFYQDYLYISEPGKGIHIIDNHNPALPKAVGFVDLLGNVDLAIRGGKLYADAFVDLLWFDISDPAHPALLGRLENMFEDVLPVTGNAFDIDYTLCYPSGVLPGDKIIVGWKLGKYTREVINVVRPGEIMMDDMMPISSSGESASGGGNGLVGSMSRFGLYDNYLYALSHNMMSVIDLSGAEPVKAAESIPVGTVETIFPYGENLFLGSPSGMMIYSVKDPVYPQYVSSIWHVYGCDPVVVDNDIAYVTVHSENTCGQNNNELLIIDVSDVTNPKPIVTYSMTRPKGLGIENGTLFICDNGLKVYKIVEPQELMSNRLAYLTGMEGYDVIPYKNVLMMIADDGLYQYDYSDLSDIKELSRIAVGR
ncbi:MAG: hypothetical protein LBI58_01230 [Tannerellaceae bacterium]|nr:hypothetical protein [Tannerellaceae bacterium]